MRILYHGDCQREPGSRAGVYRLSEEERAAIDAARRGPLAAGDEVEAFWKRRGLLDLIGKLEWDETSDYKTERQHK
jgi:hypothetical protein